MLFTFLGLVWGCVWGLELFAVGELITRTSFAWVCFVSVDGCIRFGDVVSGVLGLGTSCVCCGPIYIQFELAAALCLCLFLCGWSAVGTGVGSRFCAVVMFGVNEHFGFGFVVCFVLYRFCCF